MFIQKTGVHIIILKPRTIMITKSIIFIMHKRLFVNLWNYLRIQTLGISVQKFSSYCFIRTNENRQHPPYYNRDVFRLFQN